MQSSAGLLTQALAANVILMLQPRRVLVALGILISVHIP